MAQGPGAHTLNLCPHLESGENSNTHLLGL